MFVKSFVTELSKKIETVDMQLKEFESKMEKINSITSLLTLKTLKDIDSLKKEDLVYLEEEDYKKILEVLNIENIDNKIKEFLNKKNIILEYQKQISGEQIDIDMKDVDKALDYFEHELNYIKEYIRDFNDNNKEYYNSLKTSDNLYKKYLEYFKNNKLIKPIYNIEEFNEVIKKSGIITSEKWQLLKYIAQRNLEFKKNSNDDEKIEYSDDEIITFAEEIIKNEESLLKEITPEKVIESLNILEEDETKIKKTYKEDDIIKYQKIPVIDTLNKILKETKELLKKEKDEDATKIEKNLKEILELVDSYNVIKLKVRRYKNAKWYRCTFFTI